MKADDEVISVDDASHPQGPDATATDPLQTTTNQEIQKKTKKKKSVRKSRKREIERCGDLNLTRAPMFSISSLL